MRSGYAGTDDRWNDAGKRGSSETTYCTPSDYLSRRRFLSRPAEAELTGLVSLRKEVIQPQVLLRLPCYDFTPIMIYTLGGYSPCGSAHRLLVQTTFVM